MKNTIDCLGQSLPHCPSPRALSHNLKEIMKTQLTFIKKQILCQKIIQIIEFMSLLNLLKMLNQFSIKLTRRKFLDQFHRKELYSYVVCQDLVQL